MNQAIQCRRFPLRVLICLLALWGSIRSKSEAGFENVPKLLPDNTVVYVEAANLNALFDRVFDPKLYEYLQGFDQFRAYLASPRYAEVQSAVKLLEAGLGTDYETAVRTLLGGGVTLSLNATDQSGILTIRSKDPVMLGKLNEALLGFVNATALATGKPSPIKAIDIAGIQGWTLADQEYHVIVDGTLVVCNKLDPLKQLLARNSGNASGSSLADRPDFQQARREVSSESTLWGYLQLATIKQHPQLSAALNNKTNLFVELLAGGVWGALKDSSFAAGSLQIDAQGIKFSAWLPYNQANVVKERAWFLSTDPTKAAARTLRPANTIASFTSYRDLSGLWLAREELFDDQTNAGFAQADTQLGLFFSNRDFGTEVLGELTPRWQFVVTRQEYRGDQVVPALRIPAFALVLEMKNPDKFATQLLVGYQKIVGLFNILASQEGFASMLTTTEVHQGVQVSVTNFLVDEEIVSGKAPIQFNFSPSCARVGHYFIYGSTSDLTKELVAELKTNDPLDSIADNTLLEVDPLQVQSALAENRELLITQSMLQQGGDRSAAEQNYARLMDLLGMLNKAKMTLLTGKDTIRVEASIDLKGLR